MTNDSKLLQGARRLAAETALSKGQGRTRELHHDHRFPYMRDFESVAAGLLGDISGRADIASRAFETTDDSSSQVLQAHLTVILRAQVFLLLNTVADQYIEERAKPDIRSSEAQVNTLLRLMAESAPKPFFSHEEIASITRTVMLLTQHRSVGVVDDEITLNMAMGILKGGANAVFKHGSNSSSGTVAYDYEGLVPELGENGIELHYVPVIDRSFY